MTHEHPTRVVACDVPLASVLDRQLINAAYFKDSYCAPLSNPNASVIDIFFGVFGHHPAWIKALLIIRNQVAKLCGLDVPHASEILTTNVKPHYAVGDTIGPWPIFSLSDNELVAGRNNKHLDFRLSVLKTADDRGGNVVVSTICSVHNVYGKLYLFFITPFHTWGVQLLISRAVSAGRL
jgi:hypothetical protein